MSPTIITTGIEYAQMLDDLRALVRYEINQAPQPTALPAATTEETVTIREAAKRLNVCQQTIHTWKKNGLLVYYKLGSRTYLKWGEVVAAMRGEQRTVKTKKA